MTAKVAVRDSIGCAKTRLSNEITKLETRKIKVMDKWPSFNNAMKPQKALNLFNNLKDELSKLINIKTGKFGEMMRVSLINDGPFTVMLDSKK